MMDTSEKFAAFEPIRALLEECLEYPGETHETLSRVLNLKHPTIVGGWLNKKSVPKQHTAWREIRRTVEAYLRMLRSRPNDPAICDAEWATHFERYLDQQRLSPEAFAASVGESNRFGRRWMQFGEVPSGRSRTRVAQETGYDFDARFVPRAVMVARQTCGDLPAPLDGIGDASSLRAAIVSIRARFGVTFAQLAERSGVAKSQLEGLGSRPADARKKLYGVPAIAEVIVLLAQFLRANAEKRVLLDDADGTTRALALLQSRPHTDVRGDTRRTHVAWDRLAQQLRESHHRFLGYRAPSGEYASVLLVRFAIAYEQANCTTHEASVCTGLRADLIQSWLRVRVFPEARNVAVLEAAVEKLERFVTTARTASPALASSRAPKPRSPVSRAQPPAVPHPADRLGASGLTDGTHDMLVGMASMSRGLRAMSRGGVRIAAADRDYCIEIARTAMEMGGLSVEDLAPRRPTVVGGSAASLDAFLGGHTEDEEFTNPALPHVPRRPNGGRK